MKNIFLLNSVFLYRHMYLLQNIRQILQTYIGNKCIGTYIGTNIYIGRINSGKIFSLAQWQVFLKVVHSKRNCVMLWISVNIHLRKLNNPTRKNFIKKYSGKIIPDESTRAKEFPMNLLGQKNLR